MDRMGQTNTMEHDETNSGLAEAYGLATAIGFLSHYLRLYPIIFQCKRKVMVYCDNQGVIEWINNTGSNLYTRDTIRDDYPVYAEIQQQLRHLHPLNLIFQHIKGHQDTKRDHQLTTPERLNVDCDHRAANVQIPCPDPNIQNNPMIESAYPHLRIRGQIINRQLQHQLRDAATFRSYQEYLQNKFQWADDSVTQAHWKIHQLANQQ